MAGQGNNSLEIIKKRLSKKNVKLSDIERRSGGSVGQLSKYARGLSEPLISQVDRIADALKMTTPELLTDPDEKGPEISYQTCLKGISEHIRSSKNRGDTFRSVVIDISSYYSSL